MQPIPNGLEDTEPLPVPAPVKFNGSTDSKAPPLSGTLCDAEVAFKALSVKAAELISEPEACGVKLTLKSQDTPGASKNVAVQSAAGPEPGT